MKHRAELQLDVSRETKARITAFTALLRSWNQTINLVSKYDEPHLMERHVADSLALVPFIPSATARAIDLGSGAGFPGMVLAIATGCHFDLVEVDQRKCSFLREAARLVKAPVTIHTNRIDRVHLPQASIITARALAPVPLLLDWSSRLLSAGGTCIFPKGRNVANELTQAIAQWHMRITKWPNPIQSEANILVLSEIKRV